MHLYGGQSPDQDGTVCASTEHRCAAAVDVVRVVVVVVVVVVAVVVVAI